MRKRPTPQDEQEQDPFFEAVDRGLEFARERAVPLIYTGIALLVGLVALVWFLSDRSSQRVDAYVQMYAAQATFDQTAQAPPDERADELARAAEQFARIENADYRIQATYMQARAALDKGDAEKSSGLFRQIASPTNGVVGLYSQLSLGAALEQAQEWEDATQAYTEATLDAYASVPGFGHAAAEAAFGRARVARQMGDPAAARDAYQSIVDTYRAAQRTAIADHESELARKVGDFLQGQGEPAQEPLAPLESLESALHVWIDLTVQKAESQRTGLDAALRLRSQIESHRQAVVRMNEDAAKDVADPELNLGASAIGDAFLTPTGDQYQRAILQLARLDAMRH